MSAADGYSVFIQTIPYRFYCLFALALCGLVAFTGRDFGPMLAAERRARTTGELVRKDGTPMVSDLVTKMTPAEGVTTRAWRALVPLCVFILFTVLCVRRAQARGPRCAGARALRGRRGWRDRRFSSCSAPSSPSSTTPWSSSTTATAKGSSGMAAG